MTAFKLHHSKFYTRHTGKTDGCPHCYRCDEILKFDNCVPVRQTESGFKLAYYWSEDCVMMGATCALKAIAGL